MKNFVTGLAFLIQVSYSMESISSLHSHMLSSAAQCTTAAHILCFLDKVANLARGRGAIYGPLDVLFHSLAKVAAEPKYARIHNLVRHQSMRRDIRSAMKISTCRHAHVLVLEVNALQLLVAQNLN